MIALRARFHFRVRGILIRRDLMGGRQSTLVDGRQVDIVFPTHEVDFDEDAAAEDALLGRPDLFPPDNPPCKPCASCETSATAGPSEAFARVRVIRIDVFLTAGIGAADFAADNDASATKAMDDGIAALYDAYGTAQRAAREFLEWERTAGGQYWLGLGGETPPGLGHSELVDLDAGQMLPVSIGLQVPVFRMVAPSQIADRNRLEAVGKSIAQGKSPGLPEMLLADARYYANAAQPADPPRALLIAAVACEVKVKNTLRAVVSAAGANLLELIINRPRDYSLAAHALFNEAAKAVTGKSLKDADQELFKKVGLLFERRNQVAHRGQGPDIEEVRDLIGAARRGFDWLDSLP
jgi:hypothetical protein